MGDYRQANTSNMKVLVLLVLLGTCAAQNYNSFIHIPSYVNDAPNNIYNALSSVSSSGGGSRGNSGYSSGGGYNSGFSGSGLSYSSGGSNSGFSSRRGGSFGYSNGHSDFGGYGYSNGNGGFGGGSSFIAADNGFNSGYGGNSRSSGLGSSGFIAAGNGFNSGYGGSSGGSSGRITSLGGGNGYSRTY